MARWLISSSNHMTVPESNETSLTSSFSFTLSTNKSYKTHSFSSVATYDSYEIPWFRQKLVALSIQVFVSAKIEMGNYI